MDIVKNTENIYMEFSVSGVDYVQAQWVDSSGYINKINPKLKSSLTSGEIIDTIEIYRYARLEDIDNNTTSMFADGAAFPSVTGNVFSLSPTAQRNWGFIVNALRDGDLSTPISVSLKNDSEYIFNTSGEYINFFNVALLSGKYFYDSGRALKLQILSGTNIAEISGVIDNR